MSTPALKKTNKTTSNKISEDLKTFFAADSKSIRISKVVFSALALFSLYYFAGLGWFLTVLALLLIITFHEFGHFAVARKFGMKPTKFAIGFGPKIIAFTKNDVEYSLRLIPLGAFVKIPGMLKDEELEEGVLESQTYRAASAKHRALTVLAGPLSHFVLIFFLVILLYMIIGFHPLSQRDDFDFTLAVTSVNEGSLAEESGIVAGDRLRIVQEPVANTNLNEWTVSKVDSSDKIISTQKVRVPQDELFGIRSTREVNNTRADPITATKHIVQDTATFVPEYFKGLAAIPGKVFDFSRDSYSLQEVELEDRAVTSIVGISTLTVSSFENGSIQTFLLLLIIINFAFAVFNLLPFFPLDGGHFVVAVYEGIRSKKERYYANHRVLTYAMLSFIVILLSILVIPSLLQDIFYPVTIPG